MAFDCKRKQSCSCSNVNEIANLLGLDSIIRKRKSLHYLKPLAERGMCCVPGLIYRFLVVIIKSCETNIPQGDEEI